MDMSLMRIGTLGTYMRNMEKHAQWQMKQQSGDYLSHKKSLQEWLEETRENNPTLAESIEKQAEMDKPEIQAIYTKVQYGKKLSPAEMKYLQTNDPETYAKAVSIQQEKKAFENEIKQCRTKEDVQRLKMTRVAVSLAAVKDIESNPNISDAKKLEYVMMENARVEAISEVVDKFVEKGEYDKLPTQAEYNKVIKEENEAEKDVVSGKNEEAVTDKNDTSDKTVPDKGNEIAAEDAAKAYDEENTAKLKNDSDDNIETEEEKKGKRAKAKVAYGIFDGQNDEAAQLAAEAAKFSRMV